MDAFDVSTTIQDVLGRFKHNADQKTYVITGPSVNSIGAEVARSLALCSPKRLILVGRAQKRIQPVVDEIKTLNPSVSVYFIQMDFLDLETVRSGTFAIKEITGEIHGLINCAGIMAPREYRESKYGVESQFAANHVGHFLLTNLLIAELGRGGGVVANVSSNAYVLAEVNLDDPNFQHGETYNGWLAYGQSKTANILFTVALANRANKLGIVAFAVDPGIILETSLQENSAITQEYFMSGFEIATQRNGGIPPPQHPPVSINQGTAVLLWSVLDPALRKSSGSWLQECQIRSARDYATNADYAEKLWNLSETLVGQKFEI
ncbi:putative short-chain dehydrogenase [Thozetella sp. PMI_491]|nr:putative short-chain dehydrogenase [Thozetella sp. PMI_491]